MITRAFQKGDAASVAVYSDCTAYRYLLTREWGPGPRALFIMLNPSTATEFQNDPTVERCERRARALGFGAFVPDPVGPENDAAILQSVPWADWVICAWGSHGAHLGRGAAIAASLRATGVPLWHLGLTKAGAPKHPLYIGYDVQPVLWDHAASS
jgi:hypothetical protein